MGLLKALRAAVSSRSDESASVASPVTQGGVGAQPRAPAFHSNWSERQAKDRATQELIGLCRGILFDGAVSQTEVVNLLRWLESNPMALQAWPGNAIHARLLDALADSTVDANEELEILKLLQSVTGNPEQLDPMASAPPSLPWSTPAPEILHDGKQFCLSGEFIRAPRHVLQKMIAARGGRYIDGVSGKTNFLIVGTLGSPEWAHGSFGRKIEKAIDLRQQGRDIAIVSEKHWIQFLDAPRK